MLEAAPPSPAKSAQREEKEQAWKGALSSEPKAEALPRNQTLLQGLPGSKQPPNSSPSSLDRWREASASSQESECQRGQQKRGPEGDPNGDREGGSAVPLLKPEFYIELQLPGWSLCGNTGIRIFDGTEAQTQVILNQPAPCPPSSPPQKLCPT